MACSSKLRGDTGGDLFADVAYRSGAPFEDSHPLCPQLTANPRWR